MSITFQKKLDSEYPKLDISPLVNELRSRAGTMPQIPIDVSWQEQSACNDHDVKMFFPENGAGVKKAKAICAECEVRNECLEYALLNNIPHGVWGGASERQRVQIRRERLETHKLPLAS